MAVPFLAPPEALLLPTPQQAPELFAGTVPMAAPMAARQPRGGRTALGELKGQISMERQQTATPIRAIPVVTTTHRRDKVYITAANPITMLKLVSNMDTTNPRNIAKDKEDKPHLILQTKVIIR
jgi:hypothetical protein